MDTLESLNHSALDSKSHAVFIPKGRSALATPSSRFERLTMKCLGSAGEISVPSTFEAVKST